MPFPGLPQSFRLLFAFLVLVAALVNPAHARPDKPEPVDTSILEERDRLEGLLSPGQRIAVIEAEAKIEAGLSDIRSGEFMIDREPSRLNPDEDLSAVRKRGEALAAEGREKVRTGRQQLVGIFETAENRRVELAARMERKYDFTIPTAESEMPLREPLGAVLQATRDAGYDAIFFDQVFVVSGDGLQRLGSSDRNRIYDLAVELDSTRFTVSVPMSLRLEVAKAGSAGKKTGPAFRYDNEAAFEGEAVALLAIEWVPAAKTGAGLLSVRSFDLGNHRLIASEVRSVAAVEQIFPAYADAVARTKASESPTGQTLDASGTKTSAPEMVHANAPFSELPKHFALRDKNLWLRQFASLSEPYAFKIAFGMEASPLEGVFLETLLKHSLNSNAGLVLVEDAFITRAYGGGLDGEATEPLERATARLRIGHAADPAEEASTASPGYPLSAQERESNRIVEIGFIRLTSGTVEEAEEEE